MRGVATWAILLGAMGCAGLVEPPPKHTSEPLEWDGPGETPRSFASLGGSELDCGRVCENYASWSVSCQKGDAVSGEECLEQCAMPELRDKWSCFEHTAECAALAQCTAAM